MDDSVELKNNWKNDEFNMVLDMYPGGGFKYIIFIFFLYFPSVKTCT